MPEAGVTRALAAYTLSPADRLPQAIVRQAGRAFLNYVGCALGGADEPAVRLALAQADAFSGPRHASLVGRTLRLDAQHAALVNCLQSSIQTFDDTHLASVIHPTGPVAAAAVALLEHRPELAVDGAEFLASLAFGIELSCRVAAVLTAPGSGLHLGAFTTGLTGGIGAAAACGRLLRLDVQRQAWALGIAASQAGGLRASHATMTGGLVPALSARAGLSAALLAAAGFDCSDAALEGAKGLFAVFAPQARGEEALAGLGERFEMAELSYKPYPCGIVIHPAIDACLDLALQLHGERIASVRLTVHPLALQLTGTRHPANALSCNVSLFHWTAAALLRHRAGLQEATQAAVEDTEIAALRDRIEAQALDALQRDEAVLEIRLVSGRTLHAHVAHARGSGERPLTDAELGAKFTAMAVPRLGTTGAVRLREACGELAGAGMDWLPRLAAAWLPPDEPLQENA